MVHLYDETLINAFMQVLCCLVGLPTVFSHHTRLDLICERYASAYTYLGFHRLALSLLQRYITGFADVHLVVGKDMEAQLEGAGCTDLRQWDVGCDSDLFAPTQRDESSERGSCRCVRLRGGRGVAPGAGEACRRRAAPGVTSALW